VRALIVSTVIVATSAHALDLDSPLEDERKSVTGRVGSGLGTLVARGNYVSGNRTGRGDFTQGGGEVAFDFAALGFPTGLGGLFGFEGEIVLGLMRTEQYADGTLSDQRDEDDVADPAKMWLTTRLGARFAISPKPITFGETGALRLGLVGGLQLEGSGARSWTMAGAFTAGAHLALGTEDFGALLWWLAIPPQGEDTVLTRHTFGLDLGFGAFTFGARLQLDQISMVAMQGNPPWTMDSKTFSVSIGYRTPALKL
jgi:hypothetical protein